MAKHELKRLKLLMESKSTVSQTQGTFGYITFANEGSYHAIQSIESLQ